MGAVFELPDGLWAWSAGLREPPRSARLAAAAFYLDALDQCYTDGERRACYEAASRALESDIRPFARPAVTQVKVLSTDPLRYETDFGISAVSGPGFRVTEVSCGCRRRYYLDLRSLIAKAIAADLGAGRRDRPVHVAPLPPDLPERMLLSPLTARRDSPSP